MAKKSKCVVKIDKILKHSKEIINESDLRNADRTAFVLCELMDRLGLPDIKRKLYKYYEEN